MRLRMCLLVFVSVRERGVRMIFFFFKQKTAYEMRISDWSSDVCSSDLLARLRGRETEAAGVEAAAGQRRRKLGIRRGRGERSDAVFHADRKRPGRRQAVGSAECGRHGDAGRSEEPTSELQSLMRISYAVF